MSDSLTEAPGWFLPGTQPVQADIGILQGGTDHNYNTVYGRVTSGGAGVAGIRIGYFHWVQGEGCQQSNPIWQNLETTSDINGDYKLFTHMLPGNGYAYCITAREPEGYQQSYNPATPATGSNFSYTTTGGAIVYHPGYWGRDITLLPLPNGARALDLNNDTAIYWSAFRDDNLNGAWDDDEPAMPGVSVGGNTSGMISDLGNGAQTLAIVAPTGYVPVQDSSTTVWLNGADVSLPPLAFRFAGALMGQAFSDEDGDGRMAGDEPGLPGAVIDLTGAAQATVTTDNSGRFALPGLPDGSYTLNVIPPDGYADVPTRTITLNDGGAVSLPLHALGQITGSIYQDWDGDGQRGGDEPVENMPLTVSASGLGETRTILGSFRFWNVGSGSYTINPWWSAVSPLQASSAGSGSALALPAVPPGVVRGTLWLDANGDGLRQPWESPLAGLTVSLDSNRSMVTDQDGRYAFYQVDPGNYTITLDLPSGLQTSIPDFSMTEGRGAVIGLPTTMNSGGIIYLPLIRR